MIPDPDATPIRQALAVLFDHPELLTLDPSRAHAVEQLIAGPEDPPFAAVWQYISQHPLGGDDPWAAPVPITGADGQPIIGPDGRPLAQWALAPGLGEAIRKPLATVLRLARPSAPATGGLAAGPASRFGLQISSVGFDPASRTCTIQASNCWARHVSVYLTFFSDGRPVPLPGWTSRLPPAARRSLESDTTKYLGVVLPGSPLAGMTLPTDATTLSFKLPDLTFGARVLFGGPGLGDLNLLVDAAGMLLTAVLDHAVPLILDGAAVSLTKQAWFTAVLADPSVTAEILAAGDFLFTGSPPPDTQSVLQTIGDKLGSLLLGGALPNLSAALADQIGPQAVAKVAPVLGWGEAELAAQSGHRLQAQTSTRLLSGPATFWVDLVPARYVLLPNPDHGMWPDQAVSYSIKVTTGQGNPALITGPLPPGGGAAIGTVVPLLPAGKQITVGALVLDAAGSVWGTASAPPSFLLPADQAPSTTGLVLQERPVQIGEATQYRHWRKLVYLADLDAHCWQEGPAPSAVGLLPAPGASFRDLTDITVQERSGDLGYGWQDSSPAARYGLQNAGVIDPQARLKYSGSIFAGLASLVYDATGLAAAAAAGQGWNFYLDPTSYTADGRFHLRTVTLDGTTPFVLDQATSWGAFNDEPSRLAMHPAGLVAACLQEQDVVEVLWLPAGAGPAASAPTAALVLSPGTGIGAVGGPVATANTSNGTMLVLEQDNARVQAVDGYGNPVACFAGSPVFRLRAETVPVRYQDLAVGPGDTVYVLLYLGNSPSAQDCFLDLYRADGTFLSRTAGVAAARLAVDSWGRVYTLNYEAFTGPGGRLEPSVSQWLPAPQTGNL